MIDANILKSLKKGDIIYSKAYNDNEPLIVQSISEYSIHCFDKTGYSSYSIPFEDVDGFQRF